nr:immunoglobulin light chain junction region [Macaca mulatta]MPO03444.1 immunoglobulin light chain junction region [Macaca mulatta]MPO03668.1 immunoglobulin light chain junction region [Macaca mulatta]MPO04120.1 immunoglobulin light chain junction region [Macaca mulatta]MPO04326.1 immunoglobulin light chain junction region [Macaca mulatta]
CSSYADTNVLF